MEKTLSQVKVIEVTTHTDTRYNIVTADGVVAWGLYLNDEGVLMGDSSGSWLNEFVFGQDELTEKGEALLQVAEAIIRYNSL